jgi:hypothetical protein
MIAANDEDTDSSLMQSSDLLGQKTGCLHRCLIAIIKIACQNQRVDAFFQAQIDNTHESPPRRVPNQIGKIGIAQGKRTQRRVKVNVRGVDEAIRCDVPLPL